MLILPCSAPPLESNSWQREFARSFTHIDKLLDFLNLDPTRVDFRDNNFPLRVTRHFARLMRKGQYDDPLLKQVLPASAEHHHNPGFVSDPTGDHAAEQGQGLLQKYAGRALLITTGACAINCRYCFRRHFPYGEHNAASQHWITTLRQLRDMTDVSEVILSGGDPLVLDNKKLAPLIEGLNLIPHIKRLRIHTRLPVVLPGRIDEGFLELLKDTRLTTVLIIHANHPNEISPELRQAISALRKACIPVFNQAVLLRGINDNPETLAILSERLFEAGVVPYYLHLLDRVHGAAHFWVSAEKGREIMNILHQILPGYLVPKLVREQAGALSKLPV